ESLDRPTKVYVILSPQTRLFKEVRYLLNNAQALTDKLEVENIAPDRDETKYRDLVQKFSELTPDQFGSGRGILLLYGPEGQGKQQPPHKFIGQDKLVESTNPMRRGGESFVGEKVLMSELQFLMTEKRKSKIYFLQGDGEMSLGIGRFNFRPEPRQDMSFLGVAKLIEKLRKENME